MGTRGLVGFKYKNRYVATYNHFDSYPSSLGAEVVEFIQKVQSEQGWDKLKQNVNDIDLVNDADAPNEAHIRKYMQAGLYDNNVSSRTPKEWYSLLRHAQGAQGLSYIYTGVLNHYIDSIEFIKDSVFCEYAYVINLDTNKLDCYRGFQKVPQKGNEFGETPHREYYPCALLGSFNLNEVEFKNVEKALE
jgi:hypothetical protein